MVFSWQWIICQLKDYNLGIEVMPPTGGTARGHTPKLLTPVWSLFMISDQFGICPNKHLWNKFDQLSNRLITLELFSQRWNVSRTEISKICHCSLHTVNTWYCQSAKYSDRKPQIHHLLWLTITDRVWSSEIRNKETVNRWPITP